MNPPANNSEFSHGSHAATRGTTPFDSPREHAADSPDQLRLSETFVSRQGEGRLTGTNSFFIRTSGCNLRCWFCDTPYASWNPDGELHDIDAIVDRVIQSGVRHVVLTGGEPLLPPASVQLAEKLLSRELHLTVETAGTIYRPIPFDLLSLSPKLASSTPNPSEHARWNRLHDERRLPLDTMRALIDSAKEIQVKFVVDSERDYDEVISIVADLKVAADNVWIMPQGTTNEELDAAATWLRPWASSQAFRFCDRMQIRWYGNRRGT